MQAWNCLFPDPAQMSTGSGQPAVPSATLFQWLRGRNFHGGLSACLVRLVPCPTCRAGEDVPVLPLPFAAYVTLGKALSP